MARPDDDSIEQAIETYLLTGDHDPHYSAWTGHIIERERRAFHDLLQALWWRVSELTACSAALPESSKIDPVQLTRERVAPMVSGLFPPPA